MLFGQSKWKRDRLTEFLFQEGLIYGIWFRNPMCTLFNTVFICLPSDSTVSEDAGDRTQDGCNFGIGSHADSLNPRLDLIHYSYKCHTDTVALPPQP